MFETDPSPKGEAVSTSERNTELLCLDYEAELHVSDVECGRPLEKRGGFKNVEWNGDDGLDKGLFGGIKLLRGGRPLFGQLR